MSYLKNTKGDIAFFETRCISTTQCYIGHNCSNKAINFTLVVIKAHFLYLMISSFGVYTSDSETVDMWEMFHG